MVLDIVSVIVPIYNAATFIERCVNSILNQTYSSLEIILIDDGSTDSSLEKCKEIQNSDHRIKIISKKNGGVSAARNEGIKSASGKYIAFVDADDWMEPDALMKMMNAAEEKAADLIIAEYTRGNTEIINNTESEKIVEMSQEEAYKKVINPHGFYGSVWGKLFSKNIIDSNELLFDTDIAIGEDLLFVYQYLAMARRVYYINAVVYHYIANFESALNKDYGCDFERRMDILKVYERILDEIDIKPEIHDRAAAIYTRECCEWYSVASYYKRKDFTYTLKKKAFRYIGIFMWNDVFNIKTRISALIKLAFPVQAYNLKGKSKLLTILHRENIR